MAGIGKITAAMGASIVALVWLLPASTAEAAEDAWASPPAVPGGKVVFRVVSVEDEDGDPLAAGNEAARRLLREMKDAPLHAVIVAECFEDREYKEKLIRGVAAELPGKLILGGATYGSFSQAGCADFDSVCLLGIGGDGVSASAALVTGLGTSKLTFEEHREEIESRLRAAGAKLAAKLRRTPDDRLLVLIADAHSPKNASLVEGVQQVVGKRFPITGGSANKNAGQTFIYFAGRMYEDSAAAVMLSGDFNVSLSGRMAKDNDNVIRTAREAAAEALAAARGKPLAVLAFNCAGRKGKLDNIEDELAAIRQALGATAAPIFGCYCAGEVGPLDASEKQGDALSGGSGWHVMFTVIGAGK
jgi:hypothetical protein